MADQVTIGLSDETAAVLDHMCQALGVTRNVMIEAILLDRLVYWKAQGMTCAFPPGHGHKGSD